jgi:Uma2 family endonuclease
MTPAAQQNVRPPIYGSATIMPTLEAGDYYSRDEFIRRYEARPDIKKAELINNVVFMASPAREEHSQPEFLLGYLVSAYSFETPFVEARPNMTVNLGPGSMAHPDWYLRIEKSAGGRAAVGADKFLNTAPELVIEVAVTSASYDLHSKKDAYEQAGAAEYIVWEALDFQLRAFVFTATGFQPAEPDSDGIYKSRVFPGLWIHVAALTSGDKETLKATLQRGLESLEHAAFVAELKRRAEGTK